jgi:hypothetical protein
MQLRRILLAGRLDATAAGGRRKLVGGWWWFMTPKQDAECGAAQCCIAREGEAHQATMGTKKEQWGDKSTDGRNSIGTHRACADAAWKMGMVHWVSTSWVGIKIVCRRSL